MRNQLFQYLYINKTFQARMPGSIDRIRITCPYASI